ncbi:hypothetical protein AB0M02_15240 [Actinoplanes sp. NPDC051861]|uniref:hypothetical protein n=1 Tax=Actinoplanes sp. NPDC051861 TaxID=3155170 RepID=UPI00341F3890
MARVIADISMSLDCYVTGPSPFAGLGEALRAWALHPDTVDAAALDDAVANTGAVGYGPVLVVTRKPPSSVRLESRFSFVVDGLESAVRQGLALGGAGCGRDGRRVDDSGRADG